MGGAELDRIAPAAEELGGLQRGDAQRGAQHGHIDVRALPAGLRGAQRRGDGEGAVQPGREVRQRHAAFDGFAAGLAGDAHDAAHGLDGEVEAAFLRARAGLSVGRDRAIHQPGIARLQCLVAQAQAVHHAGTVVFDQHIDGERQLARQLQVTGVFQIQGHGALVAIERGEVLAVAVGDRRPAAQRVAAVRVLDLDHVGAHVRQQHAAERPRRHIANLQHRDAGQCRAGCHV